MQDSKIVDLVNLHAEALKDGRDISEDLLATYPQERPLLSRLFDLASKVKAALVPLDPRTDFVVNLKHRLIREARTVEQQRRERNEQLLWLAIGAGSVIYAISLLALSVRSAMWLLGLIGLLLGWRKRPALGRAHRPTRA